MAKYRGALIGCGFFAINHMHGWRDIQEVEMVAVCDQNRIRLNVVGDQFGVNDRYESAEALFAAGGFDFVDIATTVGSHVELVKLAALHNISIICQKPFAKSIDGAKEMVLAAQVAGVPLMVHENFRWQSPIQAIKSIIESGEIGEPFWGRFSFRSAYDVFSGQPYLAEGKRFIIEDLGIHTLDIARFLMGNVDALTTRTARINPEIAGEDVATMLLDHKNGACSIVDCSYATRLVDEPFPQTLAEIDGNNGTIRLRQNYALEVVTATGSYRKDLSPPLLAWASEPWHNIQESVLAIQQHWVSCLDSGMEPLTSGKDNLQTLALVEAAYLSAESGSKVTLSEIV